MGTVDEITKAKLGISGLCSANLEDTSLQAGECPRAFYLQRAAECPPPMLAHSAFVPPRVVEHLMRNKKDSALAIKFEEGNDPPDAITNMEAAMHTYVTPILKVKIHGDYRFRGHHGMLRHTNDKGRQLARNVVLSAAVQPDFEDADVMLSLMSLGESEVVGYHLPRDFRVLDTVSKQQHTKRTPYEQQIRAHLVACLTHQSRLPPLQEVEAKVVDVEECCELLERLINMSDTHECNVALQESFVELRHGDVISLEMLCRSAELQARNEIVALEQLCTQGYVYTADPPSIFAREIGAKLLNRCQFMGLKYVTSVKRIENMKIFAFNDYADQGAIKLLRSVFDSLSVKVMSKRDVFNGHGGAYEIQPEAENAVLVIHNNSDAFGQNIETEHAGGSLDGAIGFFSSAAASLLRDREDLTHYQLAIQER